ncbi:hypothetical protein CPB85DRAFT_493068 [Mucidula mucida]|nr:hypothetical protein CPB85DRAFT_493068 [Mucidula mucida]
MLFYYGKEFSLVRLRRHRRASKTAYITTCTTSRSSTTLSRCLSFWEQRLGLLLLRCQLCPSIMGPSIAIKYHKWGKKCSQHTGRFPSRAVRVSSFSTCYYPSSDSRLLLSASPRQKRLRPRGRLYWK